MPVEICDVCNLPHKEANSCDTLACVKTLKKSLADLIGRVGGPDNCRGCGVAIFWIRHRNGKQAPYTLAGLNHFIDCPVAKEFKR